jgi:hypothetical protein
VTNAEANAVNTLLRWAMSQNRPYHGPVSDVEATEAAQHLAAKAYKTLSAGLRPDEVTLDREVCAPAMHGVQMSLDVARRAQGDDR